MVVPTAGALIITSTLLITWAIFSGLWTVTTDQTDSLREAEELQADRLNTLISITSTDSYCDSYAATLENKSQGMSFGDFPKIDVFVLYSTTTGATTAERLTHPSDWTVSSISGDTTNPGVWDPDETATISFSTTHVLKTGTKGTVAVAVPGSISDSAYFDQGCSYYLHNDPIPPTGDTTSHLVLPMDEVAPSATTLFNYDTDRDASAGLLIAKGANGVGETDPTKYQVWRTGPLIGDLVITGDAIIEFWAGLEDFKLNAVGKVSIFLRDYDGNGGHTEIGNGTVFDVDWHGGSSTFVKKTMEIAGLDYTVPAGHELEAKLIVKPASADDMWFAYDTAAYPSILNLPGTAAFGTYFPHSEITTINATTYYRLRKDTPGDGTATTISSVFTPGQTGARQTHVQQR